ncbi:MAG: hypothetical protein UW82_C0012G0005 [candidate division WWE3 bacterium GW2011_GWC2_44_9]|uniref:UPF0102 protein UW82_C0012G0005 n=4 Tax=Katanobacteria TaxID=422282 RepID=A0A0G1KMG3_UNCKA|nr:MAG: hypothetical protein UW82_C0012G0005 [candidate division WWE3 bacterium GW2011_GWC2_44_9]
MVMQQVQTGRLGEAVAEKFLVGKGYQILEKNWVCRWGELDLIAEKDNMLTFVEVKCRNSQVNGHPSEAITRFKKHSLHRSIERYILTNNVTKPWKVDIVCIRKFGKAIKIDHYDYVQLY